jgi:hypothetical protein
MINIYYTIGIGLTSTYLISMCYIYIYKKSNKYDDFDKTSYDENNISTITNYKRMDVVSLNEFSNLEINKYKNNKISNDINKLIEIKKNKPSITFDNAKLELLSNDINFNYILNNKNIKNLYNL